MSNDDTDHLSNLSDGAGCTEIWEHLSEQREAAAADAEADAAAADADADSESTEAEATDEETDSEAGQDAATGVPCP